ncbi:MAG: hypothetical protein ACFFER_03350 [Candidatus Thorarchaeota archaeon]
MRVVRKHDELLCPVLSKSADENLVGCQGDRCAWGTIPINAPDKPRCAVLILAESFDFATGKHLPVIDADKL